MGSLSLPPNPLPTPDFSKSVAKDTLPWGLPSGRLFPSTENWNKILGVLTMYQLLVGHWRHSNKIDIIPAFVKLPEQN